MNEIEQLSDIEQRITDIATDVLRGNFVLAEAIASRVVAELGLTQFYAVAYDDQAQLEECYEHWDQARDLAADAVDSGYHDAHIVTGWFTGWTRA